MELSYANNWIRMGNKIAELESLYRDIVSKCGPVVSSLTLNRDIEISNAVIIYNDEAIRKFLHEEPQNDPKLKLAQRMKLSALRNTPEFIRYQEEVMRKYKIESVMKDVETFLNFISGGEVRPYIIRDDNISFKNILTGKKLNPTQNILIFDDIIDQYIDMLQNLSDQCNNVRNVISSAKQTYLANKYAPGDLYYQQTSQKYDTYVQQKLK